MPRIGLSLISKFIVVTALTTGLTSCDKKAQLQHETAQLRLTINDLQLESKKLEAEIIATGNLGRYQHTQLQHVGEIRQQIENIKAETQGLQAEKETTIKRVEALQKSLDSYRAKINN
jgi:chromosome segregation ATPase